MAMRSAGVGPVTVPGVVVKTEFVNGMPVAVISFSRKMEALCSTVLNGGMVITDTAVIIQVPPNYDCKDPKVDIARVMNHLSLPDDSIVFMTAAEVDHVMIRVDHAYNGEEACAIVTAGLSNQVIAGDELQDWERRHALSQKRREALMKVGTINTIVILPKPLTDAAKVNAVIAATEAKTAALNDLGYKETGTTSDSVAIICPTMGERVPYAGTGFGLGICLAQAVRSAVRKSLIARGDFPENMPKSESDQLKAMYG
jgi:adenosylcobinamide hydrolase